MRRQWLAVVLLVAAVVAMAPAQARQPARHTFALGHRPTSCSTASRTRSWGARCTRRGSPSSTWTHRIRMAKAMGCNTIAVYLFWNYHETSEGVFDFTTGNRDVARFIKAVQAEGLWLLLRPGPYVCAEWDFGGIPTYLLRYPDLKIRCMHPQYMQAAERYIQRLAAVVRPAAGHQRRPDPDGADRERVRQLRQRPELHGAPQAGVARQRHHRALLLRRRPDAVHARGRPRRRRRHRPRLGVGREALGTGALDVPGPARSSRRRPTPAG